MLSCLRGPLYPDRVVRFLRQISDAQADAISTLAVIGLFALSLGIMLLNYFPMKKWETKAPEERDEAMNFLGRDPLTGVKSKHTFIEKEEEI